MTNIVEPRRPGGFNELLPAEQLAFDEIVSTIRHTYESYGFSPIDTPDIELTEVLLAKGGGETEQQVYRFKRDGSDTDLTLRYDLTVPLARYVAEHESSLTFPFRRYHIGKVHRAERQQKGRYREFYQCDVDIIGTDGPEVDAELPAVINDVFSRLNFGEFTIHINNRHILSGFLTQIGTAPEKLVSILRTIDKIEKISPDNFRDTLSSQGLNDEQVAKIVDFININGSNQQTLDSLRSLAGDDGEFVSGINDLETVYKTMLALGVPEERIKIDPKIARGLDYYTGTVYETVLNGYPEIGSVCSGGRYDNLAANYTKTALPGVGISIGISRLFAKLREIPGLIDLSSQTPARVMLIPLSSGQIGYCADLASRLRHADTPNFIYLGDAPLKKKMRYASRLGVPYVAIVGEDEQNSDTVSLKNMLSGESQTINKDNLIEVTDDGKESNS